MWSNLSLLVNSLDNKFKNNQPGNGVNMIKSKVEKNRYSMVSDGSTFIGPIVTVKSNINAKDSNAINISIIPIRFELKNLIFCHGLIDVNYHPTSKVASNSR